MKNRLQIVGIGGGTGLSVLLMGLKRQLARMNHDGRMRPADITAVVSVADDGGSTGLLRRSFDIPAVGDLRNCIVALSPGNQMWSRLFQHRFEGDSGLAGHALGNLIMTALVQRSGGLSAAIGQLARALRLRGRVLPVTEDMVTLHAEYEDGVVARGESQIPSLDRRIAKLWLEPKEIAPAPGVLEALASASAIVLGPGSLYTSVLPSLLIPSVRDAILTANATRLYVCNVATQEGETAGLDLSAHVAALIAHTSPGLIDLVLANNRFDARIPSDYHAETVRLAWPPAGMRSAPRLVLDDVVDPENAHHHDPVRLASAVMRVYERESSSRRRAVRTA